MSWIPAFAGMTEEEAEMTKEIEAEMTKEIEAEMTKDANEKGYENDGRTQK